MGAYLTQPITDKISEDKSFKGMTYGVSSMQGWRITQEDAHNCITDFDTETDTSVFAVYDGHGGSEVAQYCALHLPDFIKSLPEYKTGDLAKCSRTAFIKFDATLTEEHIIKELKVLAGDDDGEDEDETSATPCVHSEAEMLKAEANMPLDQLLSKYEHLPPGLPLRNLRKSEQISSPMIRAKKTVISHCDEEEAGGSNNCVSSSDSNNSNNSSIAISLDDKLLTNGHADNENNLNKEKEIQDNLNSKHVSNSSESLSDDKRLDNIKSNDSEPSSSTDKINPVNKITTEAECSSTVGSCEENSKSEVTLSSLSIASSLVESSSSVTPSKTGGSGSSCSTTSDSGITTSTLEVSSNSQLSSSTGCGSSSSSEPSATSSSGQGGLASSSSEVGHSSSEGSVSVGPACSSSSEAGSSGPTGDRNKGAIFGLSQDDSDDEDEEDEEYEDMNSDEEDDEEEEDETEESVEHPYMDMSNEEPGSDSGCTACFTILRGKQLIVANAGDSRCVMSRAGIAVELSFDHKPEDDIEKKRIEKAGGKVTADGRVNGGLNLSRALGDHWYKRNSDLPAEEQMISAFPDIQSVMLDDEDEFIVVACDGIWNYLSSQEVVDYVRERFTSEEKRRKPSMICEEMFDYCLAPNTFGDGTGCDNMTCIIIVLHPEREPVIINRKRSTDEMENSVTDEVQLKKKAKVEEVTNSCNDVDKNEIVDGQAVSSESN